MKTAIVRRIATIGVLASFAPPAMSQTVSLKPKFEVGQKFYVEYTNQGTQQIKGGQFGPDGFTIKLTQIEGMLAEVKAASPEGTELAMTWDRVAQIMDFAMMPASFDSDKDDPKDVSNQAAVALGPKLGMPITMKLGPDARVVTCSGMTDVVAKLEKEALGVTLFEQQRPSLTDEHTASLWSNVLGALYAGRDVSPGDTWTNRVVHTVPQVGAMTYVYNCKAEEVIEDAGRKYLLVRVDGVIEIAEEARTQPNAMGMVVKAFDGKHHGVARFDIERGLFTSQDGQQIISMDMAFAGQQTTQPADDPNLMKFAMDMNVDVVLCTPEEREQMKAHNRATAAAEAEEEEEVE